MILIYFKGSFATVFLEGFTLSLIMALPLPALAQLCGPPGEITLLNQPWSAEKIAQVHLDGMERGFERQAQNVITPSLTEVATAAKTNWRYANAPGFATTFILFYIAGDETLRPRVADALTEFFADDIEGREKLIKRLQGQKPRLLYRVKSPKAKFPVASNEDTKPRPLASMLAQSCQPQGD